MPQKYGKTRYQEYEDLNKKVYELSNSITQLAEDVKWIKCMVKKLDNRIWAVLILLVSTILSSIIISILR